MITLSSQRPFEYYTDNSLTFQVNEEQTGGKRNMDLNVMSAWDQGYTGEGVTVTILDDGVDHNHPDIKRNYVSLKVCYAITLHFIEK